MSFSWSLVYLGRFFFPQAIWMIWRHWNRFIFQFGRTDPNIHSHCIKKGAGFFVILPDNSSKPSRIQVQVSWKKTIPGWVKLNTDGSIIGILRRLVKVGCCAVVMGTGSLVLRGIFGVFPAIWLSFGPLGWPLSGSTIERRQYQYDAKVIGFFLLSNLSTINLMLEPLLIVCRNLIRPFPNCTVTHI